MELGRYCHTPSYCLSQGAPTVDSTTDIPDWPFLQTTVLARAICHENPKHVKALLKKGCSPNKPVGVKELRPLMIALYMKNKEKRIAVVKSLFAFNVNPMLTDHKERNCLMYACAMAMEQEVEYLLNNYYFDLKAKDSHYNTVLHYCAMAGNLPVLRLVLTKILRYSLGINSRNSSSHTPLDVAILQCHFDSMQTLREAGGQCTLPKYQRHVFFPKIPVTDSAGSSAYSEGPTSMSYAIRKAADKKARLPRIVSKGYSFNALPPIRSLKAKDKNETGQSADDVLCRLLSLKGKRNTTCYCKPIERAPLDSQWVKSTQASMTAAFHKKTRKPFMVHSSSGSSSIMSD